MAIPSDLSPAACAALLTDNGHRDKLLVVEHKPDPYPYPLATGDGLIVSNTYWLAPARWFGPAWSYLLPDGASITPGVWEVRYPEGLKGRRPFLYRVDDLDGPVASVFRGYTDPGQYQTELAPYLIDGHQVAIRSSGGDWLAVYSRPDTIQGPERVAVRVEFLDLLAADGQPSSLKIAYGYRYDDTVTLRQLPTGPMGAVGLFLGRTNIVDGHYEDAKGVGHGRWVAREDKPEGPKLAAVVMPQRWPNGKD